MADHDVAVFDGVLLVVENLPLQEVVEGNVANARLHQPLKNWMPNWILTLMT